MTDTRQVMSDLVERLLADAAMLREIAQSYARGVDWQANLSASAEMLALSSARITALETSLAEAEGQVIAEVVAWCLREMYEPFTPLERAKALKSIATALETGEWRNAQSV